MDRNFILAIVLSGAVLLFWQVFVVQPQTEAMRAAREAAQAEQQAEKTAENAKLEDLKPGVKPLSIDEALAEAPGRVPIKTPNLEGSINLKGGRIDDLKLIQYHETVDNDSPTIRLLSPAQTEHGHYALLGWFVDDVSDRNAIWTVEDGATLTPSTPVTLMRESNGLVFEKTISVDDKFMFTVTQTVRNETDKELSVRPFGEVFQRNIPLRKGRTSYILHEGPVGVIGKELYERKYKALQKEPEKKELKETGVGGWVGITNKYWLAAVIPPPDQEMEARLANIGTTEKPVFLSAYVLPPENLAPGQSISATSHIFGGVKDVDLLQSYEHSPEKGGLGVYDFDKAVDWGHLFFLTRPIFYTLNFFGDLTGNWGLAILILTLIIKTLLFPIANKGYESMTKMKKLQPEIKKLQERYTDDKMKLQQEMMALYKKEKMNPMAGCLPIFFQMPVFWSLYKTLFVTIELRHKPFLYIRDLSAPDPTTIFNLFGVFHYDPTALPVIGHFMAIGLLPILMGIAMWFQTKLNPPPTDPVQAQVFGMLPFVFVFIFSPFAAGLVLYWFWNTTLSILQQLLIMKKNGVTVDWGERFKLPGRKKTPAPGE